MDQANVIGLVIGLVLLGAILAYRADRGGLAGLLLIVLGSLGSAAVITACVGA